MTDEKDSRPTPLNPDQGARRVTGVRSSSKVVRDSMKANYTGDTGHEHHYHPEIDEEDDGSDGVA